MKLSMCASAVFSSNGGYFDFSGLSPNDIVGTSTNVAAGGSINVTTTLLVDFILTSNKISIKSVDDLTGQILSTFTIENTSTGILIITILFPDNNNVTSGNSQNMTLIGIFTNPSPSNVIFTSNINKLGDVYSQNNTFTIQYAMIVMEI